MHETLAADCPFHHNYTVTVKIIIIHPINFQTFTLICLRLRCSLIGFRSFQHFPRLDEP